MKEHITNVMETLRNEFPQAQVAYSEGFITLGFSHTHISTATINTIERILFYRGEITTNSKELIHVSNGLVKVDVTCWSVFTRVYEYLKTLEISVKSADISDNTVAFAMCRKYLNAAQLDCVQSIINEELDTNITNHDSVRVFGDSSQHTMYLRLNKR